MSSSSAPAIAPAGDPATSAENAAATAGRGDVGDALRSIYQKTVQEDVPDEMIDLLGRLD